jgi:hypothetical protein
MERIRKLEMYEQVVTECRSLLSIPDEMSLKQYLIALSTVFERLNKAQRWIPVEERLPEEMELVLILYANGVCETDWQCNGSFSAFREITHWMPLPEPPKEVEK